MRRMRFEESSKLQEHAARLQFLPRIDGPDEPVRVLLLTSGLGFGHTRAAQAVERALEDRAVVGTVDFWSLINPGIASAIHATYLSLVQNYPQLHERLYQLDEHTWRQILESES